MLTAKEINKKYLEFFKSRKHALIESASLIPENDPTVLFTTAGMHPLVPFLIGQPHPLGKRLANVQKCLRTDDIEEVGDGCHHTFFFMLGNWSLGDYFKKEAIEMSWEFLTSPKWLGIPKDKLAVTCFEGDNDAPKDEESAAVWHSLGVPKDKIFFHNKKDNWWGPAGQSGPCGPDTEMFYYTGRKDCDCDQKGCGPGCHCGKWVEIWNDVFMEYNKSKEGVFTKLKQQNVDTGMGLERTAAVLQGAASDYETELFKPLMDWLKKNAKTHHEKSFRIIADHLRSATFVLADDKGVAPSNVEHGYILRRLIRRAIRHAKQVGIETPFCKKLAEIVVQIYGGEWPEIERNKNFVYEELEKEEKRFAETLERGLQEFEKILNYQINQLLPLSEAVKQITDAPLSKSIQEIAKQMQATQETFSNAAKIISEPALFAQIQEIAKQMQATQKTISDVVKPAHAQIQEIAKHINQIELTFKTNIISAQKAFLLFQSYGFPLEMTAELAREVNGTVDKEGFEAALEQHQKLSRESNKQKFASGLADFGEKTIALHTATHLLQAALRKILGEKVQQKGSNITPERLRFDFVYPEKVSPAQLKEAEELVNGWIKKGIKVERKEETIEAARADGALAFFTAKYGEKVSVYTIPGASKEVCTGPHVENTSKLGKFKILKEEAVSAGVRRIKAVLE